MTYLSAAWSEFNSAFVWESFYQCYAFLVGEKPEEYYIERTTKIL
jgi:hypothetical protein